MSIQSVRDFKFKRLADNSDVWKAVDYLRARGYIVHNTMNHNDIELIVNPHPKPDDMAFIKEVMFSHNRRGKA